MNDGDGEVGGVCGVGVTMLARDLSESLDAKWFWS